MKTKEYMLVSAEVPKPKMNRLRELVSEFRASGLDTARIGGTEGRDEAMRVRIYLTVYVRRNGIRGVRVVIRGFDVYLVKKED